ncbi:MAG: EAL domain-containing protein, partial [Gammaproteobacteria bacterium]|nr:EAL domain-containing protein [Gammaproteobacteria bacterium]
MEALIRWQNPERGIVSPAKFIPIAEETGLIVPIGEWVLRTACKQNQQWIENGHSPVPVAVNLSARQFHAKGLTKLVSQELESSGLEPQYLELELTESLMMQDIDLSINIMEEFDCMGVKLSIDDFGTGFSSLAYLKQLPVNELKIDKSFVIDMNKNENDKIIVQSTINLGHNLGLKVVAEGIENQELLDIASKSGCDLVQGYMFCKPQKSDQFIKFFSGKFKGSSD